MSDLRIEIDESGGLYFLCVGGENKSLLSPNGMTLQDRILTIDELRQAIAKLQAHADSWNKLRQEPGAHVLIDCLTEPKDEDEYKYLVRAKDMFDGQKSKGSTGAISIKGRLHKGIPPELPSSFDGEVWFYDETNKMIEAQPGDNQYYVRENPNTCTVGDLEMWGWCKVDEEDRMRVPIPNGTKTSGRFNIKLLNNDGEWFMHTPDTPCERVPKSADKDGD